MTATYEPCGGHVARPAFAAGREAGGLRFSVTDLDMG
ncbi:hypothetical protein Sinac_4634 [Singulisphaera acidiphila DSM 18658]|uniref:Uncharacterized protein n=1 Tax=Singulisphaera acidiphila (strain ATCC BAA-1392 / DSM 18658 / VKM B-2454 / MOB10) TaxID=886293 RepID=L0DJG4_SINAD|nr:hypothetical protein Sinac_4634 [Singulisphaera acidiphila DSM 18658]